MVSTREVVWNTSTPRDRYFSLEDAMLGTYGSQSAGRGDSLKTFKGRTDGPNGCNSSAPVVWHWSKLQWLWRNICSHWHCSPAAKLASSCWLTNNTQSSLCPQDQGHQQMPYWQFPCPSKTNYLSFVVWEVRLDLLMIGESLSMRIRQNKSGYIEQMTES